MPFDPLPLPTRGVCEVGFGGELGDSRYMVRKELKMDKLNLKRARKTWKFKERLRSGKETR